MGYTRHNVIIVTIAGYVKSLSADPGGGDRMPDIEGFRASMPEEWQRLLVGPATSVVNGYETWAFLPDGSKEGWGTSGLGDQLRERFTNLFQFTYDDGSSPFDVIVIDVRFGGDEPGCGDEPPVIVTVSPHERAQASQGDEPVMTGAEVRELLRSPESLRALPPSERVTVTGADDELLG